MRLGVELGRCNIGGKHSSSFTAKCRIVGPILDHRMTLYKIKIKINMKISHSKVIKQPKFSLTIKILHSCLYKSDVTARLAVDLLSDVTAVDSHHVQACTRSQLHGHP